MVLDKEADYIFIVDRERSNVLTDQLDQIDENYANRLFREEED